VRIRHARGSFLRSPFAVGLVLGVVIAAQGVLEAALNAEEWTGNWRTTSTSLRYATLWGACITAAATAWVIAAPRRHRYAAMLTVSSRPAWRVYRPALTAVIGGSVAGYVVVAAYAVLTTRAVATHGSLDVAELLPALGWTMAGVGFGALAGRFLPPVVAPVAAPIMPYLLPAVGMSVDFSTGRTFFGDLFALDDSARDYLRVPAELLISKSVLWILLGVAALAWALRNSRQAYPVTVLAGFAAAASFLVAGVRYDVPAEYAVTCLGNDPRVCTDRAHDHLLPQYQRLVRQQLDHLGGLSLAGYTVVQSSTMTADAQRFTGRLPDLGAGQVVVEIADGYASPAHRIDRRAFTARFGAGLFVTPCLNGPPQDGTSLTDAAARSIMLYRWWLQSNNMPTNGSNFIGEVNVDYAVSEDSDLTQRAQQFAALPDAERAAWLGRNGQSVLSCSPGADR
jgi:hypothetical protein